ncbi:hypothetical protein HN51_046901, partial [Arachis hypogaea]
DDFPPFDSSNAAHVSIKTRYHRLKTVQLRHFVRHCPMDTEDDRMEFRRHFILLVLKMFLCPTVQHVISPWHIDTVLDVSDPARYRWPLHIFNSLEQAIRKYQHKKNKSCDGCMLGLLKLKHGELEGCQEPEPWLSAWTAKELSAMTETIQPEDCGEPGRNEDDGKEDAAIEDTSDPSPEQVDVDHRKESSRRDGVREVSKHPDTHAVASDGDDDDDEPIAKKLRRRSGSTMKGGFSRASLRTTHQTGTSEDDDDDDQPIGIRICIKTLQRKTPQRGMVEGKIITSMQSQSTNQPTERVAPEPKTPSTELVEFLGVEEYSSEFFDRQANIEKGVYPSRPISIDPIQAIIPRGSSYRTPSPQRPSFSLGLTQLFKSPLPSPLRPIHPLLRGQKITEREEQRIRGWAVNTSLDSHETLASYEGRPHLVLSREDVCTLRPRAWLNNS